MYKCCIFIFIKDLKRPMPGIELNKKDAPYSHIAIRSNCPKRDSNGF